MNHNQQNICPACEGSGENKNRFNQLKAAHGSNFALAATSLMCEDCGGTGEIAATVRTLVWAKDGDTGKRQRFLGQFSNLGEAESAIHQFHFSEMVKGNAADCTFEEMDKTINPNFWEIKEGTPVSVSRPIEGISLNGDEYLLDAENNRMIFGSITEARNFLMENGSQESDLESFNFNFEETDADADEDAATDDNDDPVFAMIWGDAQGLHSSNATEILIEDNDWFAALDETDYRKAKDFMKGAEVGDSLYLCETLILRIKENVNVACECCS
jgi:hypothetical protein